jgi:hypothetical protein
VSRVLPSEPGQDPKRDAPVARSERSNAALLGQSQPWGRPDRIRLFIWAGIAFLGPVPLVLALHLELIPTGSVLTVRSELPVKAIGALSLVLATWCMSRIEKRPLADTAFHLARPSDGGFGRAPFGAS